MLHKRDKSSQPISVAPSQSWDGNDGLWSSFPIRVGHPDQDVRVFPSTAAAETWVITQAGACPDGMPLPQGTGTSKCADSRGRLFNENTTVTWVPNSKYTLGVEANLGFDSAVSYGYDTLSLGWQGSGGPTMEHQVIAELADARYWIGAFGLNPRPTNFTSFVNPQPSSMQTLRTNEQIPSLSYGYTAGAHYRFSHVFGSLTLGGYDSNLFKSNKLSISHYPDDSRDLVAGVREIKSNASSNSLLPGGAFTTFVDSTLPFIYLPKDACQAFERAFDLTYDEETSLYLLNSRQHDKLLTQNPSITFTIGAAHATSLFDGADNDTQYTLGRTFLQEAYLTVDYDRKTFNLAQRTWAQDQDANTKLVAIHPPGYSDGLSKGALAGIIVGAITALTLLIGALTFFLLRPRRQRRAAREADEKSSPTSTTSPTTTTTGSHSRGRRREDDSADDADCPTHNPFTTPSPTMGDHKSAPASSATMSSGAQTPRHHDFPNTNNSSSGVLFPIPPEDANSAGLNTLGVYARPIHEMGASPRALHEAPGAEAKWGSSRGSKMKAPIGLGVDGQQQKMELQGSGAGAWEADSAALVELPGCEAPLGMSEKLGGARLVGFDGVPRQAGSGVERERSR